MRKSVAANSAASSPPVPARTSRMALRASSASFGNSDSLTCCSSAGSRSRKICSSSSASALSSASSLDWARPESEVSSSRARCSASIPSTIGLRSLYSFDNLAKSTPVSPLPPRASRSSAWRRTSCSRCASRDDSITRLGVESLETCSQLAQRLVHRDLVLFAAVEITQRDYVTCDFVLADQHCYTCVYMVRPPHAAGDVPGIAKIHGAATVSEHLCEGQRCSFRSFPDRHDRNRPPRWRRCGS